MNTRERFHAMMQFERVDRPLLWEFGYWAPALYRWYDEGLPKVEGIADGLGGDVTFFAEVLGVDWANPYFAWDVHNHMGFDEPIHRIPANNMFVPAFETKTIEETPEFLKIIDGAGQTVEISKINGTRRHLDAPVKTRADYEEIREKQLQPNLKDRLPKDWDTKKKIYLDRTFPLEYGGMQGFFNSPRRLMG